MMTPSAARPTLVELYRRMVAIRLFEERAATLYRDGLIPGFIHLSIGQEATAVGGCALLDDADVITSTHRGHGHAIAKGADPKQMFAELLGRSTGTNHGLGGSMHIVDVARGMYGANGIVAAGLPIAVGAAFAMRYRQQGRVTVAFFGDGAPAHGTFHEAVNLAALWQLPVVFLCENNGFAEFSAAATQHPVSLQVRASGYALPYHRVDGNDVRAVADVMERVLSGVRAGEGPVIVESMTNRVDGHYSGDPQKYRDTGAEAPHDPLAVTAQMLARSGCSPENLSSISLEMADSMDRAATAAFNAPAPKHADLTEFVFSPRGTPATAAGQDEAGPTQRTSQAVRAALREALQTDPSVFLAGIDVAGGNVFGLTRGLAADFPGRVLDTPISEAAVMGLGVGAAMDGLRPVVELMYMDFLGVCLDQIMNQAAKLRFMTGGQLRIPLTIRTQIGAGRSAGAQHSQSLEAILAHIPGLTVVMPSSPADTFGLLLAAIEDDNPVIVIENRMLYEKSGPAAPPGHRVPLGKASLVRRGSDVTIVSWSRMLHLCLEVAHELAELGVSCEVIDLRTIVPTDWPAIRTSVQKTSRLLVAHEAVTDFGVGAEIAARMADECVYWLDAPVRRVGAGYTPAPYAPNLEAAWLPDTARIRQAILELLEF